MNLGYDIFKKQLIANFQNTNDKCNRIILKLPYSMKMEIYILKTFVLDFTNVEIIVACTKSTEKLSMFQVISTNVSLPCQIIHIF